MSSKISEYHKIKLKESIPVEFHKKVDEIFNEKFFEKYDTDFKRQQYFRESKCFIPPKPFLIGSKFGFKKIGGKKKWGSIPRYGYNVNLHDVLKMYFELPNIYQEIFNYVEKETSRDSSRIYTSIFSGNHWKKISKNFSNKFVLPILLYYDDFEISNPLSTAKGKYKIGGMYFTIPALPPKFRSMLENVLFAQFIFTDDYNSFKNDDKCFTEIIKQLQSLFDNGITVTINNETKTIHFVLYGILGDNLGVNSLLGYSESFTADHWCRFCRVSKYLAYKLTKEIPQYVRNSNNYLNDLKSKSCGVRKKCAFDDLPYYCNLENVICDPMHDLYLGVLRYDFARIIKYFIQKDFFTLNTLNMRLKAFNHKKNDRGNKLSEIKQKHLDDGQIIITSAQMSFLVSYFGVIIADLIPADDPVWEFYGNIFDIVNIVASSVVTESEISCLENLIKSHNEQFMTLFNEDLKPKHHMITHYPRIIREMGPLKNFSCEKFESFHQIGKNRAKMVKSRVNALLTLSNKMQFRLAERFYNSRGFCNTIAFGPKTKNKVNLKKNVYTSDCKVSHCTLNGIQYRVDDSIMLSNEPDNDPIFGTITNIIKTPKNRCFLVIKRCVTLGLNDHIKGYQILLPTNSCQERLVLLSVTKFLRPIHVHKNVSGYNIVALRDLY